jgi:sortase A
MTDHGRAVTAETEAAAAQAPEEAGTRREQAPAGEQATTHERAAADGHAVAREQAAAHEQAEARGRHAAPTARTEGEFIAEPGAQSGAEPPARDPGADAAPMAAAEPGEPAALAEPATTAARAGPEPAATPGARAEPTAQAEPEVAAPLVIHVRFEETEAAPGAGASPTAAAGPGLAASIAEAEPDGAAIPGSQATSTAPAEPEQVAAPGPQVAAIIPAEPEPKPSARAAPMGPREQLLRGVGLALILLGVFVLGFAIYLYGLSNVQEARSQSIMYERLQVELANQLAPLGSAIPGAPASSPATGATPLAAPGVPVALLRIPAIGINDMVVVQGTSPEDLTLGPGHLSDTPLPGQAGVCEIFGRRATFGAPFARLDQLQPGDVIQAITGQGTSTYRVAAIGNSKYVINDPAPNRLVLLTASSPTVPAYYIDVDARLTSSAQNGPALPQVISAPELPLSGDSGALGLIMAWALALALVSAAATIAALRWSRWAAYLVAAPVLLAVLWNLYQALSALLPNVY